MFRIIGAVEVLGAAACILSGLGHEEETDRFALLTLGACGILQSLFLFWMQAILDALKDVCGGAAKANETAARIMLAMNAVLQGQATANGGIARSNDLLADMDRHVCTGFQGICDWMASNPGENQAGEQA